MKAVITSILLDPEARGDVKTDPNYGHLREPVLLMTSLLRAFNATDASKTDGVLVSNSPSNLTNVLGQNIFNPPTVFSYFPADFNLPGTDLLAPEFGILDTSTTYARANFINTLFFTERWQRHSCEPAQPSTWYADKLRQLPGVVNHSATVGGCAGCQTHARNDVGTNESQHRHGSHRNHKCKCYDPGVTANPNSNLSGSQLVAIPGGEVDMKRTRREFMRDSACGLTAAAVVSSLDRLSAVNAMVQQQPEVASDYQALVCVF
jgi:hypothetical protein